jgi:endo-1,4-beta-mannosidase
MVNPGEFGVSFSIKQCRNFKLDPLECLNWLIKEAGFRRFRLMSYWNEHEKSPGKYDFKSLDQQVEAVRKAGGVITLCLGARQPRWPENHWPDWAWQATKEDRSAALLKYVETVVNRYKNEKHVISFQLENEALLKTFGERPEVDRQRLRQEFQLVKSLTAKPVIMSTSTSWGIPLRRPIPDIVGFSYYQVLYNSKLKRYTTAFHNPWLDRFRKFSIKLIHRKPSFIHELQLEPWGPTAIWKMTSGEQAKSMSPEQISKNIQLAKRIKAPPIDLWGGEWWYWRHQQGDDSIWQAVEKALA